jgi:hypothetical protein
MREQAAWMRNLHTKAKDNHLSLEQQMLLDAIYILRNNRKTVSLEESELLYNHYLLDSIK